MKGGILQSLRNKGITVYNENYIKINAPKEWEKTGSIDFCYNSAITGGDGRVLFDGNINTAYATLDSSSPDFKNITIEFVKAPIDIYAYSIKTLCFTPQNLLIEGSNNGNSWNEIDHITSSMATNSIITNVCSKPGRYRIIRFTQIGKNIDNNNYRLHLAEIELYGSIYRKYTMYCRKNQILLHYLFIITLSLS